MRLSGKVVANVFFLHIWREAVHYDLFAWRCPVVRRPVPPRALASAAAVVVWRAVSFPIPVPVASAPVFSLRGTASRVPVVRLVPAVAGIAIVIIISRLPSSGARVIISSISAWWRPAAVFHGASISGRADKASRVARV